MQQRRPVMLVVLDGWGWREETADNAVRLARTPVFDRLWSTCPHALLRTSNASRIFQARGPTHGPQSREGCSVSLRDTEESRLPNAFVAAGDFHFQGGSRCEAGQEA